MILRPSSLTVSIAGVWLLSASAFAEPVAQWDFGTEGTSPLRSHGGIHRDQPGPRPPEFPDMAPDNTAARFDGNGARFIIPDRGGSSEFDFANGDAITLEAWVNIAAIGSGENRYIIGKGRTNNPGFARDNQNWALRVRESNGLACVSFLFATRSDSGTTDWHRWTTGSGFPPGDGWHHIAATYRFGKPRSIRGWIDGVLHDGSWDMAGATDCPPVVDDDEIWIGSALGGSPGNSFNGLLDEIAVHREVLSKEELRARFRREGPPRSVAPGLAMPEMGEIPDHGVLITFAEGLAAHSRWPYPNETIPREVTRFVSDQFYLHRLPFRYDGYGVRASWRAPVLARLAADIDLPPGKSELLVRARGLSQLWVDGEIVAKTKPHGGSTDGHNPVVPIPDPPLPGHKPVAYGDQELRFEIERSADRRRARIVLEALVGGKPLRAEPGEMLVAIRSADGQRFELLTPGTVRHSVTGEQLSRFKSDGIEPRLAQLDRETRRKAAANRDKFWQRRREFARGWLRKNPAPEIPEIDSSPHPVDAFLNQKIQRAIAAQQATPAGEAQHFHGEVLPILSENCFRCHGDKKKGDLRLDSRAAALDVIAPNAPGESELIARITHGDADERMPPKGEGLAADEIATLKNWIAKGANWPAAPLDPNSVTPPLRVDDATFLRRIYLDTVGVPPTESELRAFLANEASNKHAKIAGALVADERFADHWVSYWQDVLAENPNMLKPSLNNTGPFRYFLLESLVDNKPFDRLVTELILLRGSEREGGAAGFGYAADNDAPFAAKAHIVGTAFLGVEMQCARCHDSPYHSTKQRDLYALAAMFKRMPVKVPASSRVPAGFFVGDKSRDALIEVTLKPGESIAPEWPFADLGAEIPTSLLDDATDSRERLAIHITAPGNERFAEVIANRVWKRLMGAGIVELAHDWESQTASHPELLRWLARDFVAHGYDFKHLVARILTSDAYSRRATGHNRDAEPGQRFFAAPDRRRLSAEQVVDSLFAAAGKNIDVEELTFDPEGRRPARTMISLGFPDRAWQFTSLSNERDRPSLSLPRARAIMDVLEAFGWTATRQNPRTDRETEPDVLQPGILANSTVTTWITRASDGSAFADLAVEAATPGELVESLFLRILTRMPSEDERGSFAADLEIGFSNRTVPADQIEPAPRPEALPAVSWSNHLSSEANVVQLERERRARAGDPPDPRLRSGWREAYEDVIWSLINSPEFVWIP